MTPRTQVSPVLDEAYERMASSGFELPNGFVNHGPMACEALSALGRDDEVDGWARRFASVPGRTPDPVVSRPLAWPDALGDYRRLPDWIGHFQRAIADDGWHEVVEVWVPRLLPSLATVLFHGAIRTAHAVRAVDGADTDARRAELARSLGYWAARYRPGQPPPEPADTDDVGQALATEAADGARRYLARPSIFNLHGVTGAMAVELLAPHISHSAATAGLAQVRAEHAALYRGMDPVEAFRVEGVSDAELIGAATASHDPHQVKLVEACRRGRAATGDPVFAAAAELVTGRHRTGPVERAAR